MAEIARERERARAATDPLTDVCVLATAERQGAPGVRALVLRDVGPDGLGLLISATSPKWEPLRSGRYECLLLWTTIRRQYRVRGGLAPMPEALVERYWRGKVHESRLLDLYYERVQAQSSPVASREAFLAGIEALRREHPTPDAVPRPALLRGVYLMPVQIEAWHGSPDRLHARQRYTRTPTGWREEVLVP
ncbi:MAG: pyridoxine 5'-phosphate oxidase C-terminal domain-containing protein [Candidatus Rokuibacteriota bacterium]